MRKIYFANILAQLFWLALSLLIGVSLSRMLFDAFIFKVIFGGVFSLLAYIIMFWLSSIFKATKDPDVVAASDLRMPVFRYKQYREWYDKHMELMKTYGCDSKEANNYFNSFFCKINTPNEWRRYQKYRYDMSHKVNHFQKGDKIKLQMEDGGSTIGTIIHEQPNLVYIVSFPFAVSIVPVKEPIGGWKDNKYPSKELRLTSEEIQGIINGEYEGTENHYHF